VAFALAGCASRPTVDDAERLLDKGDADGALAAVRAAEKGPLDREGTTRARKIAFEASLALGYTEEAAKDFLLLELAPRDRERLREKLAARTLRAALGSADGGRRALAATELAFAFGHGDVYALEQVALSDREPVVRKLAVRSLAKLPDASRAVARLTDALGDTDEDVRAAAAFALAKRIGPPHAGEPGEFAEARAALVRAAPCAETLAIVGARPAPGSALALRRAEPAPIPASSLPTFGSPDGPGARRLAWLAADRAHPRDTEALRADLRAGDPAIAPDAARLLGERGGSAALPALALALGDGAQPARPAAARALGMLGGPDAVAPLTAALSSEDGAVRRAAAEALARAGTALALDDLSRAMCEASEDTDLAAAAAVLAIEARTASPTKTNDPATQEGP
jgi:HEAT repeat protein